MRGKKKIIKKNGIILEIVLPQDEKKTLRTNIKVK